MIKNYLLITFRNMMKNKLFIIINVFGMGMGISFCIVAYFAHRYDADYDALHQNRSSIYRISAVREFNNTLTRYGYAPLPITAACGGAGHVHAWMPSARSRSAIVAN